MHHWHGDLDALDEAYVMVFGALNEHDERVAAKARCGDRLLAEEGLE